LNFEILLHFLNECGILIFREVKILFMSKGAILSFAFSFILFSCATGVTYRPLPSLSPPQTEPHPDLTLSDTPLSEPKIEWVEKREEYSLNLLPSLPSKQEPTNEPLRLPDINLTDIYLNAQRKLAITLSNIGDSPFLFGVENLTILVDGHPKKSFMLKDLSNQPSLQPKEDIILITPLTIIGRHFIEVRIESGLEMMNSYKKKYHIEKILKAPPIGPDIVVKDLDLTEDLELFILLSNAGEVDLRKGVTFRVRIFVNQRKVSDFEHFTSEALKANFGNHYSLGPPYRVAISGISKVKISILPQIPSDDIRLENNVMERTFHIYPFRIGALKRKEFSFSIPSRPPKSGRREEKVKAEARWEGGGSPFVISARGTGANKEVAPLSGRSPLKLEFPFTSGGSQREGQWKVSLFNLMEKKTVGHLIIQHP
jgi:hypothetical protein